MRDKITRRVLDAEGKRLRGRELWIWDTDVRGFYARNQGRAASSWWYGVKYRMGGKARYHVLAEDGTAIAADVCERLDLNVGAAWGPESARREAERVRGAARDGKDPDADRGTPTLRALADRYLNEHSRLFKKPRSAEEDEGLFERHLVKELGDFRLDRIDQAVITRFAEARKDTPVTANRALALLSHCYTMAARWGLVPKGANPVKGVPRFREAKRQRFLSAEELGRLGAALAELEAEGEVSRHALAAIRLLIFTGARPAEVLALRWPMVDLKRGFLNLPDSKTGEKVIHLNPPALQLLSKLPRLSGDQRVFPPIKRKASEADLESAWRRVRDRAKLDGVRLYDAARHSFASIAVSGGASLYLVGGLLGHRKASTTERYAHLSADPLRAVNDAVGRQLAIVMGQQSRRTGVHPVVSHRRRR